MNLKKWLVNKIIKGMIHIIMKVDDRDLVKVPQSGPLLMVANHVNFLDAPVIITHLHPRPTTGLVKKETWDKPFLAFLFNIWEGIPIDRDIADFSAFKAAMVALKEGKILAVAPEGTRSQTGVLNEGKPGIAMLALKAGVPIMPMAYYGHEDFPQRIKRLQRTAITIRVGEAFGLTIDKLPKDKAVLQAITDELMIEIARLLPEQYHGVYAGRLDEDHHYLVPLNGSAG